MKQKERAFLRRRFRWDTFSDLTASPSIHQPGGIDGALTYLSIFLIIDDLEKARKLIPYEPTVRVKSRVRHISMSLDTHNWCHPKKAHPDSRITEQSLAQLYAVLNAFVRGDQLAYGLDMTHLETSDSEVWEFRSYVHRPFLRVFGCFYLPKHFLAVHHSVRDDLEERRGPKWNKAIAATIKARDKYLAGYLPYTGDSFSQYAR